MILLTPARIAELRRVGAVDRAIAHWEQCSVCQTKGAHACELYIEIIRMGERQ